MIECRFAKRPDAFQHGSTFVGYTPEIVARLKQANEFRRLGQDAYTQSCLKEAGQNFMTAYDIDADIQGDIGDSPLVLHAIATDLMGLNLSLDPSLKGTSVEEFLCREILALNLRRQEILGDTPNILSALVSSLRRLGEFVWGQGNMAEAKHFFIGSTEYLLKMTVRDIHWAEKCTSSGHRLVMLADAQPASLSEVLSRLALLSEEFVGFLELQPTEDSQIAQAPFANFHADYLELALHQAPEHIPLILSALQPRKLAALVLGNLESRVQEFFGTVARRRFLATRIELRRIALGLQLLPGGAMTISTLEPTKEICRLTLKTRAISSFLS